MDEKLTATLGDNVELIDSCLKGVVLHVNKDTYTVQLSGRGCYLSLVKKDSLARVRPGSKYDRKRRPYTAKFRQYSRNGTMYSGFEYVVVIRDGITTKGGRSEYRSVRFEIVRSTKGNDYLTRRSVPIEERHRRGIKGECWEGDPKTGGAYRHKRKADAVRFALLNFCGIEWR